MKSHIARILSNVKHISVRVSSPFELAFGVEFHQILCNMVLEIENSSLGRGCMPLTCMPQVLSSDHAGREGGCEVKSHIACLSTKVMLNI